MHLLPLVVDLDGTLIKTDILLEGYVSSIGRGFEHHAGLLRSLRHSRARLKHFLAAVDIDYSTLPFDEKVLDLVRRARADGRPVYLATACNRRHAEAIADRIGLFDGVFASDRDVNLSGAAKADRLVEAFGRGGFDYIGNSSADLPIWRIAHKGIGVRTSRRVGRAIAKIDTPFEHLEEDRPSFRTWLKALRVHQYAKNTLVFVPILTTHLITLDAIVRCTVAFVAFSACASAVYLLNDLIDLEADRSHPTKRNRPFASGAISIDRAAIAIPALLGLAVLCALALSWPFAAALVFYCLLTTAYSVSLKRKMIVDVIVLAMLYTIRVVGGALAIQVYVSEWLLAFSTFIFLSLALVKRYVELKARQDLQLGDPTNRNYKVSDLSVIAALAAASGSNAVTVFALYINSNEVRVAYKHPEFLWLVCPILVYWIARALLLAHRGIMDDDPVVFALRDQVSRMAIMVMTIIVLAATLW